MRRVIRLLAGLSLLASVVAAVAMVRSFAVADGWCYLTADGQRVRQAFVNRGRVLLSESSTRYTNVSGAPRWSHQTSPPARSGVEDFASSFTTAGSFLGFGLYVQKSTDFDLAFVPLWFPLAIGLWPVVALLVRRRHPGPGHCLACGYDLRATPGRCPECGRASA